jgi:hypothetical protein
MSENISTENISTENISFDIEDTVAESQYDHLDFFINDDYIVKDDSNMSRVIDYQLNYTVKQLLQICDYYGIAKDLRLSKCNKEFIANVLVEFESCFKNVDIVERRQLLWTYMDELKQDKFMKKYIFW